MNFLKHIPYTREFEPSLMDIRGDKIQRGDLIVVKGESRTVTRVVVKVKNVEVYHMPEGFVGYDTTHPKVIYRTSQIYRVTRLFETEKSKAIGLRHYTLEQLWHRHDGAVEARDQAKAKFDERFTTGHTEAYHYEQVMVADIKAQVFQTWAKHVEQIAERINVDGETWDNMPADALAVAENMTKRFQRDILRNATRPLSRSTAVLGNIVEDVIDSVKADFIEYATGIDIWG